MSFSVGFSKRKKQVTSHTFVANVVVDTCLSYKAEYMGHHKLIRPVLGLTRDGGKPCEFCARSRVYGTTRDPCIVALHTKAPCDRLPLLSRAQSLLPASEQRSRHASRWCGSQLACQYINSARQTMIMNNHNIGREELLDWASREIQVFFFFFMLGKSLLR